MNITEIENKDLHIAPAKMNLDNRLDSDKDPLPSPLPNSSFSMAICGSSGSGKTSLMSAIITSKKKRWKTSIIYKTIFQDCHLLPNISIF